MDIVKKNLTSILCGVVAVIAVVAWFWPVSGMYQGLQKEVNKSSATYQEVVTLHKGERKLPSLVLEGATTEPRLLGRFPNDKVIAFGQEKTAALTAQSKKMLDTVSGLNVHQPLVERSLPNPIGRTSFDFVEQYLNELGLNKSKGWEMGLPAKLNATRPPSDDELTDIAEEIWNKKYKVKILVINGQSNLQQFEDEFRYEMSNLRNQERQKRALEHKIYLDEGALADSPEIQSGKQPTVPQIWFAQMVLWIEQDVVNAINAANKNSKNILDAPVKHLYSLRVPFSPEMYVLASRAPGMAGPQGTVAAPSTNANGVTEMFSLSPTGRVCGDLYDVVHFELTLRVDYRKLPQVLAEIERDRLFTILSTSVSAVDAADEYKKLGYVYGNDPVAEVTMTVEALFLRSWTVDKDNNFKNAIMPEVVMQVVGAKPGPGVIPGAMPGAEMLGAPTPPGMEP